jgi:hypothetical protein
VEVRMVCDGSSLRAEIPLPCPEEYTGVKKLEVVHALWS